MLNTLARASYDAEKAIQEANACFTMAGKHTQTTTDRHLFHKGVLIRSKMRMLSEKMNESVAKRIAATIMKQQVQQSKEPLSKLTFLKLKTGADRLT